jgi:hypothetical protein
VNLQTSSPNSCNQNSRLTESSDSAGSSTSEFGRSELLDSARSAILMSAKGSGIDQHQQKPRVSDQGDPDIVDGIPKHEKLLHESFGGGTDPLGIYRNDHPCSDPLATL